MKCKDCGAELPFGSFGYVICQFCNTSNYVPVPGGKAEVVEKEEDKKEPVKEEIQKGSSSKRLLVGLVILIFVVFVLSTIGETKTEAPKIIEETTPIATEIIKTEVPISIEETTPVTTEIIEGETDKMAENPIAVIVTNKGEFRFELYEKRAPTTVANFVELAESSFYDGLTFHRYEPGFVIQGGDPRGDGTGGSAKTISLEIHPELTHVEGAVAMARSQDPNSASSQFYVTLAPAPFLDANYAVFGKVTEGMDVVLSLRAGDKMEKVSIEK